MAARRHLGLRDPTSEVAYLASQWPRLSPCKKWCHSHFLQNFLNKQPRYSPGLTLKPRVHFNLPYVSVWILLVGPLKMKIYPGARLKWWA